MTTHQEVLLAPLHVVARRIEQGLLSATALVDLTLAAIRDIDPALAAYRTVLDEPARTAARKADTEIAAGRYRGPLHGIPVAVKELFDVQGERTLAGTRDWAAAPAPINSAAVERLTAAGAVIVGKTRMPGTALALDADGDERPVRNPWHLGRDTGGSSRGSAAAVAAGLAYGALGTDTGGSVRIPAAMCGLVGLKPAWGRISLAGVAPLSWSTDHVGLLTRGVHDAAIMLTVLTGMAEPPPLATGVRGLRIGVVALDGTRDAPGYRVLSEAAPLLEADGGVLTSVDLPECQDLTLLNALILTLELAAQLETIRRDDPDALGAIARERIPLAYAYQPTTWLRASRAVAVLRRRVTERLSGCDLLVLPTTPDEARAVGRMEHLGHFAPLRSLSLVTPFNILGWPAMTVPFDLGPQGLPLGVQLAACPGQEAALFRAAGVIERDGPWQGRTAPPIRKEH